jgi:NAD(P)-dependent dehydrogenase (short-subunit alcohol dehydrogenase family)
MVRCWANELSDSAVRANLFSPGPVLTQMRTSIIEGEDPAILPSPQTDPAGHAFWHDAGGIHDFRAKALQRARASE